MNTKVFLNKFGVVLFCILSAFSYLILFSQTLSPLYSIEACDSSVFKLMGQAVLHGKVPYADLFDHKGPMLYAIQALGQWLIPGRNGLFILAVIGLSISIFCWYQSARLFTSPFKGIIAILLSLFTYYFYAEYGNLTEDWNIPFISVAYYQILSLLFKEESEKLFIPGVVVGLCLAGSFFIRPNDAVAFIGAPVLGLLIWLIKEKRVHDVLVWIGGFVLGFSIIASIFIIWFAYHNALNDLWYGLIGFNAKYATGIKGLLKGCLKITKLSYVPFVVTLIVLATQIKGNRIIYILIPSTIAAYVLQGNNAYMHYWIVWVPVIFFSFWLIVMCQANIAFKIIAICVFLSLPIFNSRNWLKTPITMYKEVKHNIRAKDSTLVNTQCLFEEMNEVDKDSIWSYNLTWHAKGSIGSDAFNVLWVNKVIPCNRVPLIFMALRDETLYESMDVIKAQPKYILYSPDHYTPKTFEKDSLYIYENYITYKESIKPQIILYKRKQ